MYIIISGAGEVGFSIAESLSRVGHEVTVIETREDVLERAKALDVKLINDNGARMEVLESAGVEKADFYFGLTDDDEANMLGCAIAHARKCRTIARINSLKYISRPISDKFSSIGIDVAISPKLVVADKIAKIIAIPALMNRTSIAKGKMVLAEAKVPPESSICNISLARIELSAGVLIGAIFRGVEVIIPHGRTIVRTDDRLVMVLDSPDKIPSIEKFIGNIPASDKKRTDRVMIIGASETAIHLAEKLVRNDIHITIIDRSLAKCERAAGRLKKATVIHGDPTDKILLLEEGLKNIDALVSMSKGEAFNILIALLAKVYNTPKVISLIDKTNLKPMIETVGIDLAVSEKKLAVEAILQEVEHLEILRTVTLHGGDLMVFETKVARKSVAVGKQVKGLRLPKGVLIVGLLRKGKTLTPNGDDVIKKGDRVIIFCFQEMMEQIDRMFRGKGLIL